MLMSNWCNPVTVYEFEGVYDPGYLKLDPNDQESWKVYAEKIRTLMAKVLEVPKIPVSTAEMFTFWNICK